MRRVDFLYSCYHNRKYELSGHAFDGPYQAYPQPTPILTLYRIAYVFLNPETAGLVKRPEDYHWSGFLSFMGMAGSPMPVVSSPALEILDENPGPARKKFLEIVDRERRILSKRRKPTDRLSRTQILSEQFDWIVDQAKSHGATDAFTSVDLAVCWGHQCGIPPRIMARALGEPDSGRIRNFLRRLRARNSPFPPAP